MNTRNIILCALFTALTAIGAFLKIPLPEPFVPLTLQVMFTALAGVLLGSKKGAISQAVYVGIGLLGIPIFTAGGGIYYIFKPTFGYLLGFIVMAYVIGKLVESFSVKSFKNLFFASVIGLLILYIIGVIYMYFIKNIYLGTKSSFWSVMYVGAIICAPGDLISCFIVALTGSKLIPILKSQNLI